jgi:hypothetical protein
VTSIWIIEESPNPGVWNVLQSSAIYKSPARAKAVASELTVWHREALRENSPQFGHRFRATEYIPRTA